MSEEPEWVMLRLTRQQALVLFEWTYRFAEAKVLQFSHPSEAILLDHIAGELERELPEPFDSAYAALLAKARGDVLKRYKDHMGEKHSTWLGKFDYSDRAAD